MKKHGAFIALTAQLAMFLPAATAQAASRPAYSDAHDPTPLGNPGDWIRPSDYPAAALSDESEGRVAIRLQVDPKGRVSRCIVTTSSGVAQLDDTACNLVVQRAIFKPATDKHGKPAWGVFETAVVWDLHGDLPAPTPTSWTTDFVIERDGTVRDCKMWQDGVTEERLVALANECNANTYAPYRGVDGSPVAKRVRITYSAQVDPAN